MVQDDGKAYPYGPARVQMPDVNAALAVSRALGDVAMRPAVSGEPRESFIEPFLRCEV